MTYLGASMAVPEVSEAMSEILPQFVEMADLQRRASSIIARVCGSEAGFITASCSAALTLAVAAAMTGDDLGLIEQLPDTDGRLRNEVLIQTGHNVGYGAPIGQAVRLAGAKPVMVGQVTEAHAYQLAAAVTPRTAAAVYVVSHHCARYGLIQFDAFVKTAHELGLPVIVDAASEYDLRSFVERGADVVLYSTHKFLGGPTGGIFAGRKALVRSGYLQNHGVGRGMKVGKETIYGAMSALEAWERRDHEAIRMRERSYLLLWRDGLTNRPGVRTTIEPDPTGNPLDRLRVDVDPAGAGISAWDLADALAASDPPIIVRDHEAELGYVFLDPCNLHPGQEEQVLAGLLAVLDRVQRSPVVPTTLSQRQARRIDSRLRWPD
jgi:L-seryl-tRNA(Ser) seleniumtransferase